MCGLGEGGKKGLERTMTSSRDGELKNGEAKEKAEGDTVPYRT